jgi:hypothetical protein
LTEAFSWEVFMKKLIVLLVVSLVLPAFYAGCLGDKHMETAVVEEGGEAAPETAAPAEEAPVELTLTIQSITGTGSVNVDYGVTPIETCTSVPCTYTIAKGTSVTLTGIGTGGQVFYKWSGSTTGYENPKSFTIEDNMTIDAKFVTPMEPRDLGRTDPDRLREPLGVPPH